MSMVCRAIFLAVSAMTVADSVRQTHAQPVATSNPVESAPGSDSGNRTVAQMLNARYERRPILAMELGAAGEDPARRLLGHVAAGQWSQVAGDLASLSPSDAAKVHLRIISSLAEESPRTPQSPATNPFQLLTVADVVELANALPPAAPLTTGHQIQLGRLLRKALVGEVVPDSFINQLKQGAGRLGGESSEGQLAAAVMLSAAGQASAAATFFGNGLPVVQTGDPALVDLYARTIQSLAAADGASTITHGQLVEFVTALQKLAESKPAILRRQYFAPAVRISAAAGAPALLDAWLEKAFVSPEYAKDLLIGVALPAQENSADVPWKIRANRLEVHKHVVESWLKSQAGALSESLSPACDTLAEGFLFEAALADAPPPPAAPPMPPSLRAQESRMQNAPRQAEPVPANRLLQVAPSEKWRDHLSPAMRFRVKQQIVNVLLRLERIDDAVSLLAEMPHLPADQSIAAGELVLTAWTKLHARSYEKGTGNGMRNLQLAVPEATRQQNIIDLANVVSKLRAIDPAMVRASSHAAAFINTQGRAASISRKDIESAFGPFEKIDPAVATELSDSIRKTLQTAMAAAKTRPDTKSDEMLPYRGAFELVEQLMEAQARVSGSWQTMLGLATLQFDSAEYHRSFLKDTNTWLAARQRAFGSFKHAAELYFGERDKNGLGGSDLSLFTQWFSCSMGASDPSRFGSDCVPDPAQLKVLREAIAKLSPALRSDFAQQLSAQAMRVSAEGAQPFVAGALSVVGDIPGAESLVRSNAYYQNILNELKLVTTLDGDGNVGVGAPFGASVALQFTDQLDREVDGFYRLLSTGRTPQSFQSAGLRGRVNTRERAESFIRAALGEKFEVMNVLWSDGKAQAPVENTPGWQQLQLAYVLLKAKDPSVDVLPAPQIVLDFGDRTAQESVLLAVNGAALPLNAKSASERPFSLLEFTQTLNDREASQGKLSLEISLRGTGVIPKIGQLLDTSELGDFEIDKLDESDLAADRFADDVSPHQGASAARGALYSQRSAKITLKARSTRANTFRFPILARQKTSLGEPAVKLLRYSDTDIVAADSVVQVQGNYFGRRSLVLAVMVSVAVLVVALLGWLLARHRRKRVAPSERADSLVEQMSLFSAVRYLHSIRTEVASRGGVSALSDLDTTTRDLEQTYSVAGGNEPSAAQLAEIVKKWAKIVPTHRISRN